MLSLQEGGGDVAQREVVAMEEAFETVGGRGVGLGGALSVELLEQTGEPPGEGDEGGGESCHRAIYVNRSG